MSTKQRDTKNLKAGIRYNEAHVKDHQQKLREHQEHLDKMVSKKKVVAHIPLQKVGK